MIDTVVQQVMTLYPRIFFACHRRHVRDPKTRRKLSAHQASILDHLDSEEGTSLTSLAGHMGVKPSAMSIGVSRLLKQGFVMRSLDLSDRRRIVIKLSAAGARVRERGSVLDPDRLRALVSRLSAEERQEAVRGLSLLGRAASELMRESSQKRSGKEGPRRAPA